MQSATFFCSFVTKCEFSRQMYVKVTSIKFRWHLFRGCCADTWRTDGRSFWSSLRDYAKARKDRITCSRCKYSVFPNDFVNVRGEYGYCCSWLVYVVIVCVFVVLFFVCFLTLLYFTLNSGLLVTGQYSEGSATGHLDTGFSWFPCAEKQMLRWFPRFQVAIICFSCSPPDLNLVVTNFMFRLHVK